MARRVDCPLPDYPDAFVELPDVWKGLHAERREAAVRKAAEYGPTLTAFAGALALADDWSLPGLNGNPEKWDIKELDLRVIVWVNRTVNEDYAKCFIVPKDSPPALPGG